MRICEMLFKLVGAATLLLIGYPAGAQAGQVSAVQRGSDIPKSWHEPIQNQDFVKREVMIPMRDGVKLHTIIVLPRGSAGAPMLLERTPYDASSFLSGNSPRLRDRMLPGDRVWADNGYIMVAQDMRGKYGSEGTYIMTRPPIGPLNPSKTDDTTDAYDTVDWLVRHVPESNGRVGMIGSSYDGWAVVMALLSPHPALKVAAPESPMIDGWMGDDWFQHGAFRQKMFDYFVQQTSAKGSAGAVARSGRDDYQEMLDAGSAGAYAAAHGIDQLPWWLRLSAHPAYDEFWQGLALDRVVAANPSSVPTMWIQGLWDQEDIYGAVHSWEALKAKGMAATNYLAMGPWYHSQINSRGDALGPLKWSGDTSAWFRREVLVPFFDTYLRDRKSSQPTPHVILYNPAEDRWDRFADWPGAGPDRLTPMYLQPGGGLAGTRPVTARDSYISDPAKPVPFEPLPARMNDHASWSTWLVQDQRFVSTRTDVLSYQTPSLEAPIRVEGAPIADVFLSTTGTDTDVVVKIIDVYPAYDADRPDLAGYQLPVSLAIFRGRYRESFEHPSPIPAGAVKEYRFRLPMLNYTFKPGHRIMVQVQSSLFPLYDRNPQTYVPNIFFAKPGDYRPATVTIELGAQEASAVLLPIVPSSTAINQ
jgi:putative CocE/NonD family hydrolase